MGRREEKPQCLLMRSRRRDTAGSMKNEGAARHKGEGRRAKDEGEAIVRGGMPVEIMDMLLARRPSPFILHPSPFILWRHWVKTRWHDPQGRSRFEGEVQGIGWGLFQQNGSTVTGLPDVEETLNWVRLNQRFPVRIILKHADGNHPFRMGQTAVVTIRGH